MTIEPSPEIAPPDSASPKLQASADATPSLSAERERQLAARIKAGDPAAREELILANLPLVRSIASAFRGHDRIVSLDDLIQEGNLGLLRAASDFDPETHGARFANYAACWIRYKIRRVLAEQTTTIRYPYYLVLLRRRFEKARERMIADRGATAAAGESIEPDFDDVVESMGAAGERLKVLRGVRRELQSRPTVSISDPSHDAALARTSPPQEPLELAESMGRLHAAMRKLTLIESWVLRRRHRFDESFAGKKGTGRGKPPRRENAPASSPSASNRRRSFRQLSDEIGMPIHQIRAIERSALSKLHELLDPKEDGEGPERILPLDRRRPVSRKSA